MTTTDTWTTCTGWNFAPNYDSGEIVPGYHGTHIAGTIAAVNNNGEGVCGIAGGSGNGDGVRIMTIGWLADNRQTIPNWDMFAYAADNGAVIASCSWEVSSPDSLPTCRRGSITSSTTPAWMRTECRRVP